MVGRSAAWQRSGARSCQRGQVARAVRVHLRLRLRQGVFQGEASLMVGFPLILPSRCGRNGSTMAVL